MDIEQLEKLWNIAKGHPFKAFAFVIVLVLVFLAAAWLYGYMGEKGRQVAARKLKDDMSRIKAEKAETLNSQFPDGYQLFGILKGNIIPSREPPREDIDIKWNTAKILKMTNEYIDIMLPDTTLPGNNVLKSNVVRVKNQEGTVSSGHIVVNNWTTFVKILVSRENKVIAIVGYARVR
ncbi:MAG: hypothetical protein KKH04_21405 [Proteobacteria bacterium]|nr:hypothetical protein [Pseudomonadota bacterium]